MSALRRPGAGGGEAGLSYGGYYVGEPAGHRALSGAQEPAQSWGHVPHPGYYQQQQQEMGNGWGDPSRARAQQRDRIHSYLFNEGHTVEALLSHIKNKAAEEAYHSSKEQNYPAYNSGYWNSSVPPRPGYQTTYPVGPEMQGQGMEAYTNGGYGGYATVAGVINQSYPNIHPTNPFYSSGHPQASYTTEPSSVYKSSIGVPTSNPQWNYTPQQSCHADCPGHRGQVPVYPPFSAHHQTSGISAPTYSYGETNHVIPHQVPPQPRPHEETWGHQGTYGMPQPPQQHYWSPASNPSPVVPGNPFIGTSTSPWSGNGVTPTSYEAKEPSYPASYSKPEPGANHSGYYPEPSTHNMRTIQDNKPPPVNPKSHYSASPQLYENGPMKDPVNEEDDPDYGNPSSSDSLGCHPAIQKIVQVLEKVQYLDNEVEEFVGKKTDKAYKCLEELLTKELLELDSVETMGLDSIRQVRKEAVRKLQAILEKLERKGL